MENLDGGIHGGGEKVLSSWVDCQRGQWSSVALEFHQRSGHTGRPEGHTTIEVAQQNCGIAWILSQRF